MLLEFQNIILQSFLKSAWNMEGEKCWILYYGEYISRLGLYENFLLLIILKWLLY